ncbi:MAG: hypothetical protein M5U01_36020 [Ardenticatenaceae bacterium]|nr:hypothetical protein [Ardenticatenaceae bacterium]
MAAAADSEGRHATTNSSCRDNLNTSPASLLDKVPINNPIDMISLSSHLTTVRCNQECLPYLINKLQQKLEDSASNLIVQVPSRFVRENQHCPTYQRPGNRHSLLLTSRELIRKNIATVSQTDLIKQIKSRLPVTTGTAAKLKRQRNILKNSQRRDQIKKLEDESNTVPPEERPFTLAEARQRHPTDEHITARRNIDPTDKVEERTLPGSALSQQSTKLPPMKSK